MVAYLRQWSLLPAGRVSPASVWDCGVCDSLERNVRRRVQGVKRTHANMSEHAQVSSASREGTVSWFEYLIRYQCHPGYPCRVSLMPLRSDSIADPLMNFIPAVPTDIQDAVTADKPLSVVEDYKEYVHMILRAGVQNRQEMC